MANTSSPNTKRMTCLKCNNPVKPNEKFCGSCGAKLDSPLSCTKCGTQLLPNAKFCDNCGTPVGKIVVSQQPEAPETPSAAPPPQPPPMQKPKPIPKPPVTQTPPPPPPKPVVQPKVQTTAPPPPPPPVIQPPAPPSAPTGTPKPALNKRMMIVGVVVLAIILAGVFLVLPAMSGPKQSSLVSSSPTLSPTVPLSSQPTLAYQNPTSTSSSPTSLNSGTSSFQPGPTQNPSSKMMVYFSVQKDAITNDVTVTLSGGPGQVIVKNVEFQLTRSDGQVFTKDFAPNQKINEATLQGTSGADRVVVIVTYYTGEQYTMVDQLVQMRQRM